MGTRRNDPSYIFKASTQAGKVTDYLARVRSEGRDGGGGVTVVPTPPPLVARLPLFVADSPRR